MGILRVNPTRMELTRLKKKLKIATRGHKLLKDKRDELIKRFLEIVRKNKEMRERVEERLISSYGYFSIAKNVMSAEVLEQALMYPKHKTKVITENKNIMSVDMPTFKFEMNNADDIYCYGFANTSGELDYALTELSDVANDLLQLAEIEKSVELMADEIEKTRRRVNALEYVMIPNLKDTIKYITMKLDENERGNITRLMKVKDMMLNTPHM